MVRKHTCTPMFIAALFTIAKIWKQPKCPVTDEWIKKMWYIYTMEYYSAIKKEWNYVICSHMDGPGDYHTIWSKFDLEIIILTEARKKDKYHMILLICGILKNKWYKYTYLQNRNRLTDPKNKLMVTKGERWEGRDKLGVWDWHIHTAIFKIDNEQRPTV